MVSPVNFDKPTDWPMSSLSSKSQRAESPPKDSVHSDGPITLAEPAGHSNPSGNPSQTNDGQTSAKSSRLLTLESNSFAAPTTTWSPIRFPRYGALDQMSGSKVNLPKGEHHLPDGFVVWKYSPREHTETVTKPDEIPTRSSLPTDPSQCSGTSSKHSPSLEPSPESSQQTSTFKGVGIPTFSAKTLTAELPWNDVSSQLAPGMTRFWRLKMEDETPSILSFYAHTAEKTRPAWILDMEARRISCVGKTKWSLRFELVTSLVWSPDEPSKQSNVVDVKLHDPVQTFTQIEVDLFDALCDKLEGEGSLIRDGPLFKLKRDQKGFKYTGPLEFAEVSSSGSKRVEVTATLEFEVDHDWLPERWKDTGSTSDQISDMEPSRHTPSLLLALFDPSTVPRPL